MVVTLGKTYQNGGTGAAGWTNFGTPPSTIIYLSTSGGNDGNNGTNPTPNFTGTGGAGTNIGPVRSLSRAWDLFNAGVSHWVLARMDDHWIQETWPGITRNGTSGSFDGAINRWRGSTTWSGTPLLFSSYHEDYPVGTYGPNPSAATGKARPLFTVDSNQAFMLAWAGGFKKAAVVGWNIYASDRNPQNTSTTLPYYNSFYDTIGQVGIGHVQNGDIEFFLIEDCILQFLKFGATFQNDGTYTGQLSNVIVRRNVIRNNWRNGDQTSGVDLNTCFDAVIEENVYDENGWNAYLNLPAAGPQGFNHNFYLQADCYRATIRENIILNDAIGSTQMRGANYYAYNNCWSHNPINGQIVSSSVASETAITDYNVYLSGSNSGIENGNGSASGFSHQLLIAGPVQITRNVFANMLSGFNQAIRMQGSIDGNIDNNIIYKWTDNPIFVNRSPTLGEYAINVTTGGGFQAATITSAGTSDGTAGTTYINVVVAAGSGPHVGVGLRLEIATDATGHVTSVIPYFDWPEVGIYTGKDFQVGETIGTAGTNDYTIPSASIGGITGLVLTISDVSVLTQSNNKYTNAAGTWQTSVPATFGTGTKTLLTYDTFIGGDGTLNDLRSRLWARDARNWPDELNTDEINNYIRVDYGMPLEGDAPSSDWFTMRTVVGLRSV